MPTFDLDPVSEAALDTIHSPRWAEQLQERGAAAERARIRRMALDKAEQFQGLSNETADAFIDFAALLDGPTTIGPCPGCGLTLTVEEEP